MEIVEDILELTRKVRRLKPRIIAVDGTVHAGKSTLIAPALKIALGGKVIHLDRYLRRHSGHYLGSIHLAQLKADIHRALQTDDHIIIEGLLVIRILKEIGVHADLKIYAADSFWYRQWDEYEEEREDTRQIIHDEEHMMNKIERAIHPKWKYVRFSHLMKELYAYTHDVRPMHRADIVFVIDKYIV